MNTPKISLVGSASPAVRIRHGENVLDRVHLRPRTDEDNEFIRQVTEQQLVPTLERAWQFKWDRGHARKFMLDLLTIGRTLVAALPQAAAIGRSETRPSADIHPAETPAAYVWYVIQPRQWRPFPQRIFWINYLVVSARFQGHGLGSRIIEHCAQAAREAGCTSMELWVQTENATARRFYEGLNFTPFRTARGNVHMRKPLR